MTSPMFYRVNLGDCRYVLRPSGCGNNASDLPVFVPTLGHMYPNLLVGNQLHCLGLRTSVIKDVRWLSEKGTL